MKMVYMYDQYMEYFMRLAKPEQYKESVFQGMTPLQFCCHVGLVNKVQLLVKHPCVDLNMKGGVKQETALFSSIHSGNVEVLKSLAVRPDLQWNCVNNDGKPPVYDALMEGNINMLQTLASFPNIDWNKKIENYPIVQSILFWRHDGAAAARGAPQPEHWISVYSLLLKQVPSLEWSAANLHGHTLLGLALVRKDVDVALLLLKSGRLCYNNELPQLSSQLFIIKQTIRRCMDRVKQNETQFSEDVYPFLQTALDKALELEVILDLDELFV